VHVNIFDINKSGSLIWISSNTAHITDISSNLIHFHLVISSSSIHIYKTCTSFNTEISFYKWIENIRSFIKFISL